MWLLALLQHDSHMCLSGFTSLVGLYSKLLKIAIGHSYSLGCRILRSYRAEVTLNMVANRCFMTCMLFLLPYVFWLSPRSAMNFGSDSSGKYPRHLELVVLVTDGSNVLQWEDCVLTFLKMSGAMFLMNALFAKVLVTTRANDEFMKIAWDRMKETTRNDMKTRATSTNYCRTKIQYEV